MTETLSPPDMPPHHGGVEDWSRRNSTSGLPCSYRDLVGRAYIDTTHRIYAVVGETLYLENSSFASTMLLPVLYIPRDFGEFHRNDIKAVVPGVIDQFRSSGGFDAVARLAFYRSPNDERLWDIPVPEGTELKLVRPGSVWKLLSQENLLDEHFVYMPRLPGNYVPVRTILQEAGKIDAYAARMLEVGAYRGLAELMTPQDPRAADGLQFVYRLFDKDGKLLYVGVTANLVKRKMQHARVQSWWSEVVRTSVQCFDNREAAEYAEAEAIASEHPLHNRKSPSPSEREKLAEAVTGNSGGSFKAAEHLAAKDQTIEQLRKLNLALEAKLDEADILPSFVEETLALYLPEGSQTVIRDVMARIIEKTSELFSHQEDKNARNVYPLSEIPLSSRPETS